MELSIITPCSRPYNLPTIYSSILEMNTPNVEWLVIYDNIDIDKRILMYEKDVSIRLFKSLRQVGDNYASRQRNIGIENATGDYLYFLDDDNLVHNKLYEKIKLYGDGNKILIFNLFTRTMKRKIKKFNLSKHNPSTIDTAQIVVPKKYKSRWRNDKKLIEEYDYIEDLRKEAGDENFLFVNKIFTYYNYLRRFKVR